MMLQGQVENWDLMQSLLRGDSMWNAVLGLKLDGEPVTIIHRNKMVLTKKNRARLDDPLCLEPLKELGRMIANVIEHDIGKARSLWETLPQRRAERLAAREQRLREEKELLEWRKTVQSQEWKEMLKELHKRPPPGPSPEPVHMASDLYCSQCGRTLYDVECARCGGLLEVAA